MGLSMFKQDIHFVEWWTWDLETGEIGTRKAMELYDLNADPDENHNIAAEVEDQAILFVGVQSKAASDALI